MPLKRSRSTSSFRSRVKRARRSGSMYKGQIGLGRRAMTRIKTVRLASKVNNLYKMIETKELTWKLESTRSPLVQNFIAHNNLTLWSQNPLQVSQGAADAMQEGNQVNRLGDRITIKGMMFKLFLENAAQRPKVHYRVMLIRASKGDTIDRSTLFKGNCSNKMLDQVNTERFSIVAQKTFNISVSNSSWTAVDGNGQAYMGDTTRVGAGVGTKVINIWVPGTKFGSGGNIQYENGSYQVKFYDYRWVIVAYDWFGTPQDINNVGLINCMYAKTYFKDA